MTHLDAELEALEASLINIDDIISQIDPIIDPLSLDRWQGIRAAYVNRQAVVFARKEGL